MHMVPCYQDGHWGWIMCTRTHGQGVHDRFSSWIHVSLHCEDQHWHILLNNHERCYTNAYGVDLKPSQNRAAHLYAERCTNSSVAHAILVGKVVGSIETKNSGAALYANAGAVDSADACDENAPSLCLLPNILYCVTSDN